MAKDKKSFVAYADWIDSFEELSDEEAGRLVKHIFRYVNDLSPEAPDKLTKVAFIGIKNTLKRDLDKYESIRERNAKNGAKGGRPKKTKENPKKAVGLIDNPNEPKKADSDSDSDSDSSFKEEPSQIIDSKHELPEDATESHFEYLKNNYNSTLYQSYKRTEDFKHILKLKDSDQKTFIKRFDAKCLEQGIPYNGARIAGRLKGFTNSWVSNLKTQSKKGML